MFRLLGLSTEFATAAMLSSLDAAVTISHRLPLLASGNGQDEAVRMVSEKIEAAVRGSLDATVVAGALFGQVATGQLAAHELPEGFLMVGQAALAPAYSKVRANAQRLSQR
jgi:hypothetical protein